MGFNCLNCGKEVPYKKNTSNKYCDNKCQKEYERNKRIDSWLKEGISWKRKIPQWAKNYLKSIRGAKCEICGISEWNGKDIVLECDHIDGVHYNNDLSNLRMICPNCHSQTETFKNKNRGNGRRLNNAPKA